MDLRLFFDNFEVIAAAPNGVKKLRELILQLAVRGKLVPQDPADEPAGKLLERIQGEKNTILKSNNTKTAKNLPRIKSEDLPFHIPPSWRWVHINEIIIKITDGEHISPQKKSFGVPLLSAKHVRDNDLSFDDVQYVSQEDADFFRQRCDPEQGDILICSRGTIGRCAVVKSKSLFCLMGSVILLKPSKYSISDYLRYWLITPWAQALMTGMSGATAVKALYLKDIRLCLIPLPPIAEQKRIVTKVDELMKLCDILETQQQQNRSHLTQMQKSAIAQLLSAPDADAFAQHWQDIVENFELLFDDGGAIGDLRQAVLQLAVQGRLVKQNSADEPASVLMKKIRSDVKVGNSKSRSKSSDLNEEDQNLLFKVPLNWAWVNGCELALFITSGSRGWAQYYSNSGAIFLRIGNLDYGTTQLDLDSIQYVDPPSGAEGTRTKVQKNDILISITGDTGMIGLVPDKLPEAYINQHIALFRPSNQVYSEYIAIFFTSPLAFLQLQGAQRGIKNSLGLDDIRNISLPLPPLAEQKRIVAKVNQLMKLCNTLQAHLTQRQTSAIDLAEVAVRQVLDR